MLWLNITNLIEVDGELSTDGGEAVGNSGGGGSGGSIWMYCRVFRGLGNLIPSAQNIIYCAAGILFCKIYLCRKELLVFKRKYIMQSFNPSCFIIVSSKIIISDNCRLKMNIILVSPNLRKIMQ